jgi:hypothetical protein
MLITLQLSDDSVNSANTDKGKPVERRGRKATGLKDEVLRRRGCQMVGGVRIPARHDSQATAKWNPTR